MDNGFIGLAKKLHGFLFDFSAAQNNRREVEDILLAALAQSATDTEFRQALHRVIFAYEGDKVEGEARFHGFTRFMTRNRRRSDRDAGIRIRAEHLLEDLPRIYGDKKHKPIPLPRPASQVQESAETSRRTTTTKEDNADV